ncbi:GntR family transcriptional regulator [Propionivibrio sp.]|uniref:GntR family transcriptional regulator n=1 Tax=Propionivibrio sp. TaxID=2212460 RepID=UPI002619B6A5|nr:GntR family transcriptional regulator [Propionivibrio sp.]
MNAPTTPAAVQRASHPVPLYIQIREALRSRIVDGSYHQNDRLPSESELMRHHGVSRITVRQALGDLESEGLIFRVVGKGSFVLRLKPFEELTRLRGFGEAMSRLGYETRNWVESLGTVAATQAVARRLGLAHEELVTRDIFLIIENNYGIPLGQAELSIEATVADPVLAGLLEMSDGAPVLRIERLNHSAAGVPLDFEYLY